MKKKLLLVALCFACVASFAQTKKRSTTTKRSTTKRTSTAKPAATKPAATQVSDASTSAGASTAPVVTPNDAAQGVNFEAPMDGYYKKNNIAQAKPTPYANIREGDAIFAKRIWRDIDVREKRNQFLVSPKARLIDVLMDAISKGELTAYSPVPTKDDPGGDMFKVPLSAAKARATMADSIVVDKFDKNTGDKIGSSVQAGEFNPDSIVRFRIKEDWIFDKQRSVFEPRIVGIAPMIKQKVAGVDFDYQPAFWVYFPAARNIFATKEAMNRNNDATSLSYDDIFMKRLFASVIVKQSNDKDERIKDYMDGIDRLYEAERIKKSLMDWELGLWQY